MRLSAALNWLPDDPARRHRQLIELGIAVLLGLLAATVAKVLGGSSNKVIAVVMFGVLAAPVVLWVRDPQLLASLTVAGLAFTVPLNLDFNLFYRPHVGGAPSITVNLTLLMLIAFYVLWIYRMTVGLQPAVLTLHRPIGWSGFALLVVPLFSLINASHVDLVWMEWFRLFCMVAAMFALMSLQSERLLRLWITILSVQVFIQACLAAAQYGLKRSLGLSMFGEEALVQQDIGHVVNRATGTVGHPNVLSYFFEILLPVMLALALARQPVHRRLWFGLVFVAGIGGILTTLSRGSWLTLPVSLGIVFLMTYGHRIVRVKAAATAFLLGCGLLVALYFAYPTIEKRFTHTDYKSAGSRMPLNRAAWSIIEQFPVVGVGLNNFAENFKRYDKTGFSRIFRGYRHVVHNLHLWIWTETGTLGLLAYLAPFLVTIWVGWRHAPHAPPVPRAIMVGIAAGLLAHLMHGMVDPGFRVSLTVSFLIFTSMGVVGALAMRYPVRARQ